MSPEIAVKTLSDIFGVEIPLELATEALAELDTYEDLERLLVAPKCERPDCAVLHTGWSKSRIQNRLTELTIRRSHE